MANKFHIVPDVLHEYGIIPRPGKGISIENRIKILDTSLELYKKAIDRCDAANIGNIAVKIGAHSAALRAELGTEKGDIALKSLTDLSLIEKGFMDQHNRLMEGRCKCITKWLFF